MSDERAVSTEEIEPASGSERGAGPVPLPALLAMPEASPAPREWLASEPSRFSIDQATAVVALGRDPVDVNFRSVTRLGAPAGEVEAILPDDDGLLSPAFGLVGPGGVMPRHYTALADGRSRQRSTPLHDLLDLVARRFTGLYVKAGAKNQVMRSPALAQQVLASAVGLGTPHLDDLFDTPFSALLHEAGSLASRTRSAERLRGMLEEEVDCAVRIHEFAGGWVRLPPGEQTRLGGGTSDGHFGRLGQDAAIGQDCWDASASFDIELGPVDLRQFRALLPGQPLHTRLVELTRLFVGAETAFVLRPVLKPDQVPSLRLGDPDARLGWASWLTSSKPRRQPLRDARLGTGSPAAAPTSPTPLPTTP